MAGSSTLPPEDQKLIEAARRKCWFEINPDEAKSEEGRCILDDMARRGYRREEVRCGMG